MVNSKLNVSLKYTNGDLVFQGIGPNTAIGFVKDVLDGKYDRKEGKILSIDIEISKDSI